MLPRRPGAGISRHLGLKRWVMGTVTAAALTMAGLAAAPAALAQTVSTPFTYETGAPTQTYTVPAGITLVTITADGGAGAATPYDGGAGGAGGAVTATVPVTPGETLNVVVGGGAGADGNMCGGVDATSCGGPGAGAGGNSDSPTATLDSGVGTGGGGGGGASEVSDASNNPLVVTGGGGGGGATDGGVCETSGPTGGAGGAAGSPGATAGTCTGSPSIGLGTSYGGAGGGTGTATAGGSGGAGGTGGTCSSNTDGAAGDTATGPAGADGTVTNVYPSDEAGGAGGGGYFGGGSGGTGEFCQGEGGAQEEAGSGGGGGGSDFTVSGATDVTTGPYTPSSGDNGQVTISYTDTAPEITSPASGSALPAATAGQSYSATITATGEPVPTFSATGLPSGLSINPNSGMITGTATTAGSYSVTVTVSNGVAPAAMATYSLTVAAGAAADVTIDTGNNQSANTGQAFGTPLSVTVTDADGNPVPDTTVTFSIVSGTGGSANFGSSGQTVTETTNASGVATAPTLDAGSTAGAVAVTATAGTGSATFVETVTSTGPARADLAISMSAPKTLAPGATGTITLTVTNNGPSAATNVLTLLAVPHDLTITSAGGGTLHGAVDFFTASTLASGAKLTYTVTVKAGNARALLLLLAGTGSATRDPDLFNNIAAAFLTIT
jgi:uncharacterized repeat protein (TIGR01451 family)